MAMPMVERGGIDDYKTGKKRVAMRTAQDIMLVFFWSVIQMNHFPPTPDSLPPTAPPLDALLPLCLATMTGKKYR